MPYPIPNEVSKKDASWLLRDKYKGIENEEYAKDIERLSQGEPLNYVIGWVPFLGTHIKLTSRPLIPRPETEWWVEKLISILSTKFSTDAFTLLDMGAGSGAIGCSILAHLPNAHVSFGEINKKHLETILSNIIDNDIDIARTDIRAGNLFEKFENRKFNVIISNPPYVPKNRELPKSVSSYEPSEALYAGEDGLSIIHELAKKLSEHLTQNGFAWIEVDTEHAQEAENLFIQAHFNTKILNDQYGRARVVMAY